MRFMLHAKWTLLLVMTLSLTAADHKEAPLVDEFLPADIADLYAFLNPQDDSELVVAMTVNPFSIPAEAGAFNFSPRLRYQIQFDNDGDAVVDAAISVRFQADQSFTASFPDGTVISGQATAPTLNEAANEPLIYTQDGNRIFAGPRDDPFFFDFVGFARVLAGTGTFSGTDTFAGFNVSAIVASIPVASVSNGGNIVNIWATTEEGGNLPFKNKTQVRNQSLIPERFLWRQIDRMANPGVATALIPSGLKDAYNRGRPDRDGQDFAGSIVATLQALGTNDENIGILASVAVPDLLTIDVSAPSGFPNGRALTDDVIDTLFFFIFNQVAVGDGVTGNDTDFLDTFPYLAPPWQP